MADYTYNYYWSATKGVAFNKAAKVADGPDIYIEDEGVITPINGLSYTSWEEDYSAVYVRISGTPTATGTYHLLVSSYCEGDGTSIDSHIYVTVSNPTYTVTFASNNTGYGTVSPTSIANVPYGSSITVNSNKVTINGTTVTATKATDTAQYAYSFSSWSNTSGTITAARTITANFSRSTRNYTATIAVSPSGYGTVSPTSITKAYNSVISTSSNKVTVGDTTSTATPATATAQYTYAFSSWTNGTGNLTANRTITANFTRSTNNYTATIKVSPAGYGTVSPTSITKPYNSAISTSGATVTVGDGSSTATPAAQTAQYTYAFSSWTNGSGNLTANRDITANFTRTTRTYTVTWKNWDGTVLETDTGVAYGTTPTYNSATPTRTADAQYTYTFSGWSPAVGAITGATTYTAQFSSTLRNYAITVNVDSSADYGSISPTTVANKDYGSAYSVSGTTLTVGGTNVVATANTATAQYTYGFDGWYIGSTKITTAGTITGATTFTAKFTRTVNQYAISTAVNPANTGSVTGGGTYNYGATATLTATAATGYVFEKWQDDSTTNPRTVMVTGAATYTAYFIPDAPSIGVKVNGSWVSGTPWVKVNGNWVKSKKMYVNDNGTWKEIKRF